MVCVSMFPSREKYACNMCRCLVLSMVMAKRVVKPEVPPEEDRHTRQWQKKLRPFMIAMLAGLTLFFFVASFVQLFHLHGKIEDSPPLDFKPAFSAVSGGLAVADMEQKQRVMEWQTYATLEGHARQRRYHQANVLLMARVWVQYLSFVTGMMLCMVGAVFILGKMRAGETKLEQETAGLHKFNVASSSPGLILAVLGTALIITSMVTHHEITVSDSPIYISRISGYQATDARSQPGAMEDSGEGLGVDEEAESQMLEKIY